MTLKNKLTASAKRDALSVCGGLYRMNAMGAVGYAFNYNKKEVTSGEFIFASELERAKKEYEAFYCFTRKAFIIRKVNV